MIFRHLQAVVERRLLLRVVGHLPVVEQVAAALPSGGQIGFYRTAAGAEMDLVVQSGCERTGIEIKFSASTKPIKGFWQATQDLAIERAFVVAPVLRSYPLAPGVEVVPVYRRRPQTRRFGMLESWSMRICWSTFNTRERSFVRAHKLS